MCKLTFSVPSYKAIRNTTITNEGITVLAGINGSGKSTLARMMYYTVNTMRGFEGRVFNKAKAEVEVLIGRYGDILLQTNREPKFVVDLRDKINKITVSPNFPQIVANCVALASFVEPYLYGFFLNAEDKQIERILNSLEISRIADLNLLAARCSEHLMEKVHEITDSAEIEIHEKKHSRLLYYIRRYGVDMVDFPDDFSMSESDVDLISEGTFNPPLSLQRAIYVDTPMAVNDNFNNSTKYWNNLTSLMSSDEKNDLTYEEKMILHRLHSILHGDVFYENDPLIGYAKLRYKREDGLDIELVNAATGFKSFAILFKLLANGYLKNNTLLLVDEPEAHLHPQWVVEYANILVKLNKLLGVKIVVTSHNPDMVSALHDITEAEGVQETTHFYLAKECDDEKFCYQYEDLGTNIAPVFDSFNYAFVKIEQYGANRGL